MEKEYIWYHLHDRFIKGLIAEANNEIPCKKKSFNRRLVNAGHSIINLTSDG